MLTFPFHYFGSSTEAYYESNSFSRGVVVISRSHIGKPTITPSNSAEKKFLLLLG